MATTAALSADTATVTIAVALLVVGLGSMASAGVLLLRRRSTLPKFGTPARTGVASPPNAQCPICNAPVVVASQYMRPSIAGPMFAPRPSAELASACVDHGRSPFNDMTARWRATTTGGGDSEHRAIPDDR